MAVPRGGPGYPGGGGHYGGGYRPVYGYPGYWGGWGLGWGWGGYWGYGAWGWWGPGWWGPGYASSMWWPGFGWWGAPALYAPPYAIWGITSEARLMVQPRNTEVYIDGALAGIVDQYDGVFQSLTLSPGTHEIAFYLEGHKKQVMNAYVAPGTTLKVKHTMEKLPAGAPEDERPSPPARPQPATNRLPGDPNAPQGQEPPTRAPRTQESDRVAGDAGLLVIRVQPADAEVVIDGQPWTLPGNGRPLEVRVPAGRVRIDIRKPGFAPFSTEVTVTAGEVTPLNVSLPSRGQQL
ncbi:PEGA domain-containing protein [Luteitalea sp. TBR-22]|uniref:PEGA domain-containing protein n=1 Tax=Luteitalea sp. TBR-22 TaxID=2802971 RepID=UPI001EF4258D|nr:PEGA domain-containing protein [Luteitalea sp. TBR-22]